MTQNEKLIKHASMQHAFFLVHALAVEKFELLGRMLDDDQPDAFDGVIENLIVEVPDAEGLILQLADTSNAIEAMSKIFHPETHITIAFELCKLYLEHDILASYDYDMGYANGMDITVIQVYFRDTKQNIVASKITGFVHGEYDLTDPKQYAEVMEFATSNDATYNI